MYIIARTEIEQALIANELAVREVPDVWNEKYERTPDPLCRWMQENIHQHGQRYRTQELVRRATGEEITADHFPDYIADKYGTLYSS
jgi:carboxypeptidase Taq